MMGEERLNALLLAYIHWDIHLDYDKIIDMYASKYPWKEDTFNQSSKWKLNCWNV